MKLGQ